MVTAVSLSAAITLASLPEIAGSFGRVSLLSPATNLLAGLPASAALGWGADRLEIRSGDGRTGVTLRLLPGEPEEIRPAKRPVSGTEISIWLAEMPDRSTVTT